MREPYKHIPGFECDDIADEYEKIYLPDGSEVVLTEPEDRTFYRDIKPLVEHAKKLYADHARLVALVKALPLIEGKLELWEHDNGFMWTILTNPASSFARTFDQKKEAEAYMALLAARKEMGG